MAKENLITRLAGQGKLDATIEKLADEFGIPHGSSSGGDYKISLAREQVVIALMSVPNVFRPYKLPSHIGPLTKAQREVLSNFMSYQPHTNFRDFLPLVERAVSLYAIYEPKRT